MAIHLNEFNIEHFRGINHLELKDLNDINIITGDNNSGKTSVLENINFLSGVNNLRNLIYNTRNAINRIQPSGISGLSEYDKISFLFPADKDFTDTINYSFIINHSKYNVTIKKEETIETLSKSEIDALQSRTATNAHDDLFNEELSDVRKMHLTFKINDQINETDFYEFSRTYFSNEASLSFIDTTYISPFKHTENSILLSKILNDPSLYEEMLDILKAFDKGILSLNMDTLSEHSHAKSFTILSKEHNRAIPLMYYGDGMKKAILLMSSVITSKNGILLLDEFETAIHTSAMDGIFKWILDTCLKLNVQVFLTSHSKEAIEKVLKCSPDLQNRINLYTLYKKDNQSLVRKLTCFEAIEANDSLGLELR